MQLPLPDLYGPLQHLKKMEIALRRWNGYLASIQLQFHLLLHIKIKIPILFSFDPDTENQIHKAVPQTGYCTVETGSLSNRRSESITLCSASLACSILSEYPMPNVKSILLRDSRDMFTTVPFAMGPLGKMIVLLSDVVITVQNI